MNLTVPSAGNCEDDTILICDSDEGLMSTGWYGLDRSLVINGQVVRPEDSEKYLQTISEHSFSLIIHHTNLSDEGYYRCKVGFTETIPVLLRVECKYHCIQSSL